APPASPLVAPRASGLAPPASPLAPLALVAPRPSRLLPRPSSPLRRRPSRPSPLVTPSGVASSPLALLDSRVSKRIASKVDRSGLRAARCGLLVVPRGLLRGLSSSFRDAFSLTGMRSFSA
ncbi:hypothetical protein OC834_007836, partial [Tilletia horrida]